MAVVPIGGQNFDAYTSVAEADVFLAGDVARAAAWALQNPDAKGRGLVSASRMILQLPWCLDPAPLPTDAAVPDEVKQVTAMLAADLLAKPRLFSNASGNSNVKSAKAGSAQVEFFAPVGGAPPIPMALWTVLKNAGLVGCVDAGEISGFPFVSGAQGECRPLGGRYGCDWPTAEQDYS